MNNKEFIIKLDTNLINVLVQIDELYILLDDQTSKIQLICFLEWGAPIFNTSSEMIIYSSFSKKKNSIFAKIKILDLWNNYSNFIKKGDLRMFNIYLRCFIPIELQNSLYELNYINASKNTNLFIVNNSIGWNCFLYRSSLCLWVCFYFIVNPKNQLYIIIDSNYKMHILNKLDFFTFIYKLPFDFIFLSVKKYKPFF